MFDKWLRNFAEENFGDEDKNYFPVYHGKIQEIKPFALMVKIPERSIWKRPFKKYRYRVLGGIETYVATDKKQKFMDALNENIKNEDRDIKLQEEDEVDYKGAERDLELGVQVANCANAKIKINEDLGNLELGKIDEEYIRDPELREILAKTKLSSAKMEPFKDCELHLITSVIYSERFVLEGHREHQFEVGAGVQIPNIPHAQLQGHYKKGIIPPKLATRNTRGPFLFQCCRVVYNEETNRLELAKGEVVGKEIYGDGQTVEEEKEEYENAAVDLEEDEQNDLADAYEDGKKWDKIINLVLKPTENREERKARVNKYLQWFERALERALTENQMLTENQRTLSFDQPLTEEDCKFLQRGIFIPCRIEDRMVKLPKTVDEDTIQGYAIVLKKIAGLSDKDWDEVEKAWTEGA